MPVNPCVGLYSSREKDDLGVFHSLLCLPLGRNKHMSFLCRCIWESINKKVLQRALIPGGGLPCSEVAGEHLDKCSLLCK